MQTNKSISLLTACLAVLAVVGVGCKKYTDNLTVPPSESHFAAPAALGGNPASGTYFIVPGAVTPFNVPVGVTTTAKVDRKINFTISSTTGAAANTQYTVAGLTPVGTTGSQAGTITIPAGQSLGTIVVNGIAAGYPGNRIDTILFTITGGDVTPSKFGSVYRLVVTKSCPVTNALNGNYTRTNEYSGGAFSYGPYTTIVKNFTSTSATTATVQIQNLYDDGWSDITVNLSFATPTTFTATIPLQPTGRSYAGGATSVRTTAGRVNTFSSCDNTFNFFVDLVNGSTVIASAYEFRMAR